MFERALFGLLPKQTLPKYWSAHEIWQPFRSLPNNWLAEPTCRMRFFRQLAGESKALQSSAKKLEAELPSFPWWVPCTLPFFSIATQFWQSEYMWAMYLLF
jgi:hypothetical protein